MQSKINKLPKNTKLIIVSLILMALTNPYSIGYISLSLDWLSEKITKYGYIGFIVSLAGLALCNVYIVWQSRDQVNIPKKTAKTNKVKYLED